MRHLLLTQFGVFTLNQPVSLSYIPSAVRVAPISYAGCAQQLAVSTATWRDELSCEGNDELRQSSTSAHEWSRTQRGRYGYAGMVEQFGLLERYVRSLFGPLFSGAQSYSAE